MQLSKDIYTSVEVAEILCISLRTLYRYLRAGLIKSVTREKTSRGGHKNHRFTKGEIMKFLEGGDR